MKTVSLPSPPQPSFAEGLTFNSSLSSPSASMRRTKSPLASKTVAPLDAAFLGRVARTTIWFGAFLTVCVALVSRQFAMTISFAAGALLSLALLKSQQMFVARLARSKKVATQQSWIARLPLVFLLPAKYVLIAVGIYLGLKFQVLVPAAFATGFTVLQIVVFSKVVSLAILNNQKPLHEVYVSNEK